VRIIGKVFGLGVAIFGFITSILDIREMIYMASKLPILPNANEFAQSGIVVLVISILLTIAGVVIFRMSK
jgi:uncharacterized membrane protein YdbT with pleckstrin-like domain